MKKKLCKCHLLISGNKHESMICKIVSSQVIETHLVKPLGVKIESELSFNTYLITVCKKASQKLLHSQGCALLSNLINTGA